MAAFDAIDVIRAKRDGTELSAEQIRWMIDAYTQGAVPDEQVSALLMAIFFRGMAPDELAVWTQAMIDSGERKDLSSLGRPTADKHSTSGASGNVILSPTPPVECLSAVGRPSEDRSLRSPESIIACVHTASSSGDMPRKNTAMSSALICSCGTSPAV